MQKWKLSKLVNVSSVILAVARVQTWFLTDSPTRLMHGNELLATISGAGSAVIGPNLLQKCTGRNDADALQKELDFWTA